MNWVVFLVLSVILTGILIVFRPNRGSTQFRDTEHVLCNKNSKECSFPQCSKPCCNTILVEMLGFVSDLFRKNNLPLWITYGTLLGWRRHQGTIPWDNDIDTMTTVSSKEIEKLRPEIERMGYVLEHTKKDKKGGSYPPAYDYYTLYYSERNRNHLDIGLATEAGKFLFDGPSSFKETVLENPEKYKQWLSLKEDVFPLKDALFYDVPVSVPKNPENILFEMYGKDCLEIARVKIGDVPGTTENLKEQVITEFLPGKLLKKQTENLEPNEKYGIYRAFIINLEHQHDRLHHAIEECEKQRIPAERVIAVKGKDIEKMPENTEYDFKKNEIGCYLSHVKAMQRIAEMPDSSRCIIFEDDIQFRPNFPMIMPKVKQELDTLNWDVIFLGLNPYEKSEISPITENLGVFGLSTGTWAYMLTPESARRILTEIFPINYPVDLVLTAPNKLFPTDGKYDHRFQDRLNTFVVLTDCQDSPNSRCRYGIVEELSTGARTSTSSL